MRRVRICLIGCGAVARLHGRIARTLGREVSLLYASRSLEKAEAYRRRFGGQGAFGSYAEACASPSVDAVFICTPHAFHLEHAVLAAAHKKPMLIEKPAARDLEELDAIAAAVAAAGTIAMVAENYFFKPAVRTLRTHIERGDIGEPLVVELNRANRSRVRGWRADAELMGGGALLEGGVHWINYLCSLGGEVREVLALRPRKGYAMVAPFEDTLEVVVRFADGAVGKLLHSWNLRNRLGGVQMSRIFGTEGNILFESNGIFAIVAGRRTRLRLPGLLDLMGYRGMLRHFVACVRERREPAMSLAVARRDLAIVAAAYRSLESGKLERPEGTAGEETKGG